MQYKVESISLVGFTRNKERSHSFGLDRLEVEQSIFVPTGDASKKIAQCFVSKINKRYKEKKFITRSVDEGVRIGRIK